MSVLQRAAASGQNFIITHEPTFYNHLDQTTSFANDPVYQEKQRFIAEHHMVVWRFHDHWHHAPLLRYDGILKGMTELVGWQQYQDPKEPHEFALPRTDLKTLAANLQARLHSNFIRVIGDPKMKVTKVYFMPGAAGEEMQIKALERPEVQLLVAGESREWETVEYTRDASEQRRKKALILLGHNISEEYGMAECAEWLKTILPGMPVQYVPAHEPFWKP
jgi:putative NIF3 family GTP cyclohydrolase 1 type 2